MRKWFFISYEKYRDSIIFNGKRTLEKGFGKLPIEIQNDIKEKYERRQTTD